MRHLILTLIIALAATTACKTDEEATTDEPETTTEQPAATNGGPAEPAEEPAEEATADAPGKFGGLVDGATTVTITQSKPDGEADYGGSERVVTDTAWITQFVTAIGPNQPGAEAVPKCLPTYNMTFANEEGELASFGGVCAGSDTVILVRDGAAYTATDSKMAREMLRALAAE